VSWDVHSKVTEASQSLVALTSLKSASNLQLDK